MRTLSDRLQTLIQLTIDQQTSTDKKEINMTPDRQINDLIQLSHSHFIRVDQNSKLFLALLPGFY